MKSTRAEKVVYNNSTAPAVSPTPPSASPSAAPKRAERPPRWRPAENILQTAAASRRFETLGRALQATGLAVVLSEKGPFTLFAPTDKAFAKMPPAELDALLADEARLRRVLTYHIVPKKVRAPRKDLPTSVTTLDGGELEIAVALEDGGYRVEAARIVKTNLHASNGVIHAIDTVLVPR